jgi:hypothetical protein
MKENWNKLDKPARIRLVILALIILWCTYSVIAYTYEIYHLDISQGMVDTRNMGPIWIDGSDFTPIFKALGSGTNGLVILIIYGVYTLAMMVMSVVPMLIYWLAAIRRAENIVWEEAELAKNICGLGGFLGLVIGIGVTGFSTKNTAGMVYTLLAAVGISAGDHSDAETLGPAGCAGNAAAKQ